MSKHQPPYTAFYNEVAAPETLELMRAALGPAFDLRALPQEDDSLALEEARHAELLLAGWRPVSATLIESAGRLRLIHKLGAGIEKIDLAAARRAGIPVTAAAGSNAHQVAEHTILLMLALLRRLIEADRGVRAGRFEKNAFRPRVRSLHGKTVGIIGLGNIGRAVAERLLAFGCRLLYFDLKRADPAVEQRCGAEFRPLEELLPEVDILTLHLPLTAQTRGLLGARQLALLHTQALLINTARGPIVAWEPLREALASGKLGGAGLDVYQVEPPPSDDPLLRLDNVVLTPHIAGSSRENIAALADEARENFLAVLSGREPRQRVA